MRARARKQVERGPITDAYAADRDRVIAVLNEILATELVCDSALQTAPFHGGRNQRRPCCAGISTARHHRATTRRHGGAADLAARRGTELLSEGLATRSYTEYDPSSGLLEMVKEDLVVERIAIACYQELVRWLANDDPTTRRMIETILAQKETHAEDLLNVLQEMNPAAADRSALHVAIPAPNGNGVTPFKLHQVPPRGET